MLLRKLVRSGTGRVRKAGTILRLLLGCIWFGPLEVLDAQGAILHSYQYTHPHLENLATGAKGGPSAVLFLVETSGKPIPPGAHKLRLRVRLVDPNRNATVAVGRPYEVEVRDASETVQLDIPAGSSQIAFSPIPVTLNFSTNQSPGLATAKEFQGQFGAPPQTGSLAKPADFYWDFIPINRYWSVYDTLKEGTFKATVTFAYDPVTDFPSVPGFNEDSLVVAGLNPMSGELEALASTLAKTMHTITTEYTKFFDTYVVASRATLPTAVASASRAQLPERFSLEQNYPNPFNPVTTIKFSVKEQCQVLLRVYDILGREVVTLVDSKHEPGFYRVSFNAQNLASGVYFYKIQMEDFQAVRKMVVLE